MVSKSDIDYQRKVCVIGERTQAGLKPLEDWPTFNNAKLDVLTSLETVVASLPLFQPREPQGHLRLGIVHTAPTFGAF